MEATSFYSFYYNDKRYTYQVFPSLLAAEYPWPSRAIIMQSRLAYSGWSHHAIKYYNR